MPDNSRTSNNFPDGSRPLPQWSTRLFLVLFTSGGVFFAVLGLGETITAYHQLEQIASTTGTITGPTVAAAERNQLPGKFFYRYQVDGVEYVSSQIWPGWVVVNSIDGPSNSRPIRRLFAAYPPGKKVAVWYPAGNPGVAFLRPVQRSGFRLGCLIGSILAMVGLGLLLPMFLQNVRARFGASCVLLVSSQIVTFAVCTFVIRSAPTQPDDQALIGWLSLAYVLVCLVAFIGNAPPQWNRIKQATLVTVGCGTALMSLSLLVLIPLSWIAPKWNVMHAFPWIGIAGGAVAFGLWISGLLKTAPDVAAIMREE